MPNEDSHILPLKNGSQAKVRHALGQRSRLEYLLTKHPEHFEVLLQIVRGVREFSERIPEHACRDSIRYLTLVGMIKKDGTVSPLVRDVLLSGYQVTPEGPVIAQPFDLKNETDKNLVDTVENKITTSRQQWMRNLSPDPDDGPSL